MLKVTQLNVSIQGVSILQNANLHIPAGAMVGLVGRNGAGKTTFMRSVMGLLDANSGEVLFEGTDLLPTPAHSRANNDIGYLPEDRRLIPQFTVEENMMVPLWATKRMDRVDRVQWVYELMPEIARFKDRQAMSLSGGQQKLVALGRALVCGSKLLLLDEPFEGVAPALARRLLEVIATLKQEKISVLISESDYTHSKDLVDDVYSIERGQIT
jgi:branched-chain amino acid transport system ATP-binding protein